MAPKDTVFILTTAHRGAMLATILSRVRTYTFFERSIKNQKEVLDRVFHYVPSYSDSSNIETINDFLLSYLPISPETVKHTAASFFDTVKKGHIPDIPAIIKNCANFTPRILFKIFLETIIESQNVLKSSSQGSEVSYKILNLLRDVYNSVTIYNQTPAAALEELTRSILLVNAENYNILREL